MTRTKYYLLSFVILLSLSFFSYFIPKGSLIAGGDFYQLSDYREKYERYSYAWFDQLGQGSQNSLFVTLPFYFLLNILSSFLSVSRIATFIFFSFVFLSFLSFWYSITLLFPNLKDEEKFIGSMIYALNNFIIIAFSYSWGITHHFLIYLFFPLLISNFILTIVRKNLSLANIFMKHSFILAISTISFNNISFLFLVVFVQLLLLISLLLLKVIKVKLELLRRLLFIGFSYLLTCTGAVMPVLMKVVFNSGKNFTNQKALGGENYLFSWISNTSSNFTNSFLITINNYKYPFVNHDYSILMVISSAYFFLMLLWLLVNNKNKSFLVSKKNPMFVSLFLVYLVLVLFSVRFYSALTPILKPIYLFPLFIFFRSSDKIFLTIPFFFSALVVFLFQSQSKKRKYYLMFATAFPLVFPYLFQITRYSLLKQYNHFSGNNNETYSYIVKIPDEYKQLSNLINKENKETAVVSLPYSVKNSINWSNYPNWGFVGHDIIHTMLNHRFISSNTYDNPILENRLSFKKYNDDKEDINILKQYLTNFGAEFVIYHKDIAQSWINSSMYIKSSIDHLEMEGYLEKMMTNDHFNLYRINKSQLLPIISAENNRLTFRKINPTRYVVNIKSNTDFTVKFLQSFDSSWKVRLIPEKSGVLNCENSNIYEYVPVEECYSENKFITNNIVSTFMYKIPNIDHFECLGYANCWKFSASGNGGKDNLIKFVIYYDQQYIVYFQYAIIIIVLLTCSIYLFNLKKYEL